ncbi:ABC transporter substrate-binding protein [Roseococcus pinisoli]|uniref:ABC transporter substrate-binding protein n=1 Tax=Roseococcus pinisoli TaxID=2835040 RepID=A0ABS5Q6W0_9PROT|nr:ABC transporter substrate-binding protein [Roseococcus pinisoli]MBS7809355.1 ABC transporter substrate-binding protein [Roseococcus pinisoli]
MHTRRLLLLAPALLAPALAALPRPASAQSAPTEVVERFHAALLGVMRNAQRLGIRGRNEQLTPVMDQVFDLSAMTRIAAGANWANLSPDQRNTLTDAFRRWSIATYASRFDGYSGESFQTVGTQTLANGDTLVRTRLNRTDGDPVVLSYLLRGQPPRVVDVYLTGTISELASRRSEFATLIREGGAPRLIQELQSRTSRLLAA